MATTYRAGQVVMVSGDPLSLISRAIMWATRSKWSHCFLVISPTEGLEAVFPDVRRVNLDERVARYRAEGREIVVLDHPLLNGFDREQLARAARHYEGWRYDAIAWFLYGLTRNFRYHHPRRTTCGRLITQVYGDCRLELFDEDYLTPFFVLKQFRGGYVTPGEIMERSQLKPMSLIHLPDVVVPTDDADADFVVTIIDGEVATVVSVGEQGVCRHE